ncbi:MAG: hypothetical protein RLZZ519_1762 [Bacteroidota bacterium]|jgi:hypothetical protein
MKTENEKVPGWVLAYRRKQEEFWQKTYPAKTWEAKVQHWVDGFQEMMKASTTSGADAYEGFNPMAYEEWKLQEPQIDSILEVLMDRLPAFDSVRMWEGIRSEKD